MSSLHTNQNFIGLDLFHSPPDLSPQMLTQADNLLVDGGSLVTRPGFAGLLAAVMGAPIYTPTAYLDTDGTTKIVFVSGGRLYKWAKGTSAATEIVIPGISGTINGPGSRIARLGHYGYLVDGAIGLVRFDLTGGRVVSGLAQPSPAPVAALTSTALDSLLTGTWAPDALTGAGQANRLPNSNFATFTNPSGSHDIPTGYDVYAFDPDLYGSGHPFSPPGGPAGSWLLLDHPGEGMLLSAALTNDGVTGDPLRYARHFYVGMRLWQSDPTGLGTILVSVLAYSDAAGTVLIGEQVLELSGPFQSNLYAQYLDGVISFQSSTSEVLSYRVKLVGGAKVQPGGGGNNCTYLTDVVCFPFSLPATVSVSGSQLAVTSPATLAFTGGPAGVTTSTPNLLAQGRGAGGLHLGKDYGAAQDWHLWSHITLGLSKAMGITQNGTSPPQAGPVLRLAFRQSGSTTRYYTNPLTVSADGTYASVDISTVPVAVLSSFRYLEICFGGDFTTPSSSGADLVLLGPITGAGNLGTNYAYYWAYVEVDANGDPLLINIIQSNASALSATLTATLTQAEAAITLPAAPTNASATMFYLYRFGGVFTDGIGRLVTKRKFTDTVLYGADTGQPGSTLNRPNPYISYAGTAFIDNTPDLFLLSAEPLVTGRDAPPAGASSICAWQARLFLGKGGMVYASWAVTLDMQDALYFTLANLTADPLTKVKGFTFSVGQDDNDAVQALLPIATNAFFSKGFLGILKQHSIWLLSGTDPSNFTLQSYLIGSGRGCIAPRGACLVEGQIWYVRADGVSSFNGDTPTNQSQPVEALVRPQVGAVQQVPAAFTGAAMVYHGRRVLAFLPVPGDAKNTSALVYDTRQNGWTRLLCPFGVTGAASASSETDNDDLYLAGSDGQLYQVTGTADLALPASAPAAIAFTAKSRGFGQESGDLTRWTLNTAVRAFAEVNSPAALAGTLSLDTEAIAGFWSQGYTFAAGVCGPRLKVPPGVKGVYHVLGVTGAATVRTRINSFALESAETGVTQ